MLKRILVAVALVFAPAFAFGQATVIQGGSQTQGHIPAYATTGGTPVVTDGGTSAGGVLGANPSTIGITARCADPPCVAEGAGPNGEDFAIFDGPTSDADGYHYLGFSANIGSKATITTGAGGGAAAQGLQFIIDGTTYAFPEDFPQIPVEVDEGGTGRQTLTQYNLLVGAGTSPVGLIAPSATSGIPLVSQGSSANPAYGTAAVAGGGTGATTANDALNNLLPAQAGQNGKVLSTDGTDASWVNIPGTGTVTSVTFTDGLTADINPCVAACTAGLATIADDRLLANVSGGAAVPTATTTSALLDATVGSAQGSLATRGAATWGALTPGTNGYALLSQGPGADLVFGQYLINNLAIASQAQGDITYYNGSIWTRLPIGTQGYALTSNGAAANPSWQPGVLQKAISGLRMSNGADITNDISVNTGMAANSAGTAYMVLASSLTKQLDAVWASGTNAGGRFDTSISDGVWGVYLISNGSAVDVGFSKTIGNPTGEANYPVGYTSYRRIGYIVRASAAILVFVDRGNGMINLTTPVENYDGTVNNSRTLVTSTAPANTLGQFRAYLLNSAGATTALIQPTAETDATPSGSATPGVTIASETANQAGAWQGSVWVDASQQIAVRSSQASSTMQVVTIGWTDYRGQEE